MDVVIKKWQSAVGSETYKWAGSGWCLSQGQPVPEGLHTRRWSLPMGDVFRKLLVELLTPCHLARRTSAFGSHGHWGLS